MLLLSFFEGEIERSVLLEERPPSNMPVVHETGWHRWDGGTVSHHAERETTQPSAHLRTRQAVVYHAT